MHFILASTISTTSTAIATATDAAIIDAEFDIKTTETPTTTESSTISTTAAAGDAEASTTEATAENTEAPGFGMVDPTEASGPTSTTPAFDPLASSATNSTEASPPNQIEATEAPELIAILPPTDTLGSLIDKIEDAGTKCWCEDLNNRASTLEQAPTCALTHKMVQDRDVFAGNATVIAATCNVIDDDTTCVDGVVDIVEGLIEYNCEITQANADFLYINNAPSDFKKMTYFACNSNDCYAALRTCQRDNSCLETISCDCMLGFMQISPKFTPDTKQDLISDAIPTFREMELAVEQCKCDNLNAQAASVQNRDYCALHKSIIEEGYLFTEEAFDIQSTCAKPQACVEDMTNIVAIIDNEGCEVKQETDFSAKFLFNVNGNAADWDAITNFICNADDECYDEVEVVVSNATYSWSVMGDLYSYDCKEFEQCDCLESFVNMIDRMSDNKLLGIDSNVLRRIKLGEWDVPTAAPTSCAGRHDASFKSATISYLFALGVIYFFRAG